MTALLRPVSEAALGRPPLQVKAMKVRLPEGIGERIDALVGPKRRAEFIRDAVVAEVEKREAAAQLPPSMAKE